MQKLSKKANKKKIEYIKRYQKEKTRRIEIRFFNEEYDQIMKDLNNFKTKKTYKTVFFKGLETLKKEEKN